MVQIEHIGLGTLLFRVCPRHDAVDTVEEFLDLVGEGDTLDRASGFSLLLGVGLDRGQVAVAWQNRHVSTKQQHGGIALFSHVSESKG